MRKVTEHRRLFSEGKDHVRQFKHRMARVMALYETHTDKEGGERKVGRVIKG